MSRKNNRYRWSDWMVVCLKGVFTSVVVLAGVVAVPAHAFVLGGTRVIMEEGKISTIQVISSPQDNLLLIKARVARDVSMQTSAPELLVSPPLFRLDPGARNQLRLTMVNPAGLPRDRESVRYLNVSGIPSSNPLSPDRGKMQAGMVIGQGAIIKVFWRPKGLPVPPDTTLHALRAHRVPAGIALENPTPYYISFSMLTADGKYMTPAKDAQAMLAPFSSQVYGTASVQKKEVQWTALNDLGAPVKGQTVVH
ncbi:molecular chaperone [Erwinia endophytica]|uniref:fimbrial biogenesis chaperone n=1 Tax=Erwinia endophytica TaxID=1563158 RepID=UPI00186B8FEC|nr:molecular chaperone [Erwinia endophytica]